jgi:C2 domain
VRWKLSQSDLSIPRHYLITQSKMAQRPSQVSFNEELLRKVLICLLVPNTYNVGSQREPEIQSSLLSKLKNIHIELSPPKLPILPGGSSKLTMELANILQTDPGTFKEAVMSISNTYSLLTIVHDMFIYRHLLQKDCIPYLPSYNSIENYKRWKAEEDQQLASLIQTRSGNYVEMYEGLDTSKRLVLLQIMEASNLLGKDSNKSSNPYCLISYAGVSFVSQICERNLNPQFNYCVALYTFLI